MSDKITVDVAVLATEGYAELVELSKGPNLKKVLVTRVKGGPIYGGMYYVPEHKQWGWRSVDGSCINLNLLTATAALLRHLNEERKVG